MIIRAELKCKQTGCEADPCAVDKVIELPSPRFQQFSRALLADYDFIAENKNAIRHDDDARHCLLILDAEGTDGFLIDPQGYNYARYSAFVPNARSLLTPDVAIDRSYISLAEPWRDESRDEMLRMTLHVNGKPDYSPEIEPPLMAFLKMLSADSNGALIVDSLKSVTRNITKLLSILEFLLTRDLIFASTNYYMENGHVERRMKPLRAGHSTNDMLRNVSNTSGLGYKHKAALSQYAKQAKSTE